MGNFNRSFNRDRRPSGGGRSFDRGTRDREMHRTTCSNCGKECEVPFKPNGSKPVFCSDCFEKNGGEQRRSNDRDYSAPRRSNFEDRRPSFNENRGYDRPQNFDRPQASERPQQNNNAQFAELSSKLDRIITLLTPKLVAEKVPAEPVTQSEESAPIVGKKAKSPRKPKTAPVEVSE